MKYWLALSEPEIFSINDLEKCQGKTTCWEGARNSQTNIYMRDEMKLGDPVLFYSCCFEEPAVVGVCEVVKEGYPDYTAFDPKSKYYDPNSRKENPTWIMVDIKLVKKFTKPVGLNEIRLKKSLCKITLAQTSSRLSIMPLSKEEYEEIILMSFK